MSKSQLTKLEMLPRVLKLKVQLDEGIIGSDWSEDQKYSAHCAINLVLDIIEEYRY